MVLAISSRYVRVWGTLCVVLLFISITGCPSTMPPGGNGNGTPNPLPDVDGDGVADNVDLCANTPTDESVDLDGCAPSQVDTDGDGVFDDIDECEDTPTDVMINEVGCPVSAGGDDSDEDEVNDDIDQCADTPTGAEVNPNGCAQSQLDSDEDGLTNDVDLCEDTPTDATVDDDGCADSQLDDDNDEVTNDLDQCPNTPRNTTVNSVGCVINSPPPPPEGCGDGIINGSEQCDDSGESANCNINCTFSTCGDNIVNFTANEQCDDGNINIGDGCDANCQSEAGALNDLCSEAITITDGITDFNTTGATTDGAPESTCAFGFGDAQINSDIWFAYVATCDGEALASLCGSSFDTKMAVYEAITCPTVAPITCSDDDCGVGGFDSRVTFQAQQGQTYMIRIGGFQTDQGAGMLTIRCGGDPCGAGSGTCGSASSTPGCDDAACCQTTCNVDPFCCDVEWDEFCAEESMGLCSGSFAACETGAGTCAAGNDSPGCDDVDCCNTVCMNDPFCCIDTWDDICSEEANAACFLTCGDADAGGCFTSNGSPGCDEASCCETVCALDDLCCTGLWDDICVDLATTNCR